MSKTDRDQKRNFLQFARDRFARDCEEERDIRAESRIDLDFRSGEQWDPTVKKAREDEKRPALTSDRTHIYIQSVANDARQNKPAAKVNPLGGGATTDTANVLNGIIRHVNHRSQADRAWDTALDYSAGSSFGYVRAITEYVKKSMDQEIRIVNVADPFSVYGVLIPACRGTECKHMFIVSRMPRTEYKAKYGSDDQPVDFDSSEWAEAGDWLDEDSVRVAEYWYCEEETKTLRFVQGGDGSVAGIYTDDKNYSEKLPFVMDDDGVTPLERDEEVSTVKFCTIDGARVLPGSETEWVGDSIPCVAVLGQQLIKDGEVHLFSLIRFVRDTQRLINLYQSSIAEKMALSNRVPYVGYKGQFVDGKWKDANVRNYPYLEAEPVMINGTIAPLPQRQQLEEQIQALSVALANEVQNLKSGMGIYDQSLGEGRSEQSGIGIRQRKQQSAIINFHFSDNLNRAQWDMEAKLLKVIPKIYDRPGRQVRIVGEDQVHSVIVVNQKYRDEEGKDKHFPLDVGEYDIMISVQASYADARQEAADTLQQFFSVAPQAAGLLADLWVGNLDYPWAREAARRLKAAAPQNIVNEPEDQDGAAPIPPQILQQIEQLTKEAQEAHAFAQTLHQQIATKQPEIEARERMHAADLDFKREQLAATTAIAAGQQANTAAIAELQHMVAGIQHERELLAARESQQRDHAHALQLQAAQPDLGQAEPDQAQPDQPAAPAGPEPAAPAPEPLAA